MPLHQDASCQTRIVACRGAVQLASAIAAMRTVAASTSGTTSWKNHLVIYGLSAPEGQAEEFANCIRGLAELAENWESIRYVAPAEIPELQHRAKRTAGNETALAAEIVGVSTCNELYTGQDDQFVTTWLRRSYGNARQVCFGDGIGLNFTNSYFRPKDYSLVANRRPYLKRLSRRIKAAFKGLVSRIGTPSPPSEPRGFDVHCLLLKNLFDQHLPNVLPIDGAIFIDLFRDFAADFCEKAPDIDRQLTTLQSLPGKNAILLTSNFSETNRMTLEGEIDGYLQLLQRMPQGKDVALIIKPHPRDSYEKIRLLEEVSADRYGTTLALMDPWTFYFPFESLYWRYFANSARPTSIATVSSAAISLEYLYGQHCHLGFGPQTVTNSFAPLWQPLRQLHEEDLVAIINNLRRMRPHFRVSSQAA